MSLLIAVVVAASDDDYDIGLNGVHQTMLVIDTPRPISREITLERFGLANPLKGRSKNVLDDLVDSLQQFAIALLKPLVITPGRRRESEIHS